MELEKVIFKQDEFIKEQEKEKEFLKEKEKSLKVKLAEGDQPKKEKEEQRSERKMISMLEEISQNMSRLEK